LTLVGVPKPERCVGFSCEALAGEVKDPDHPFRLHALANVRPLRPVRVLLAGRDPRYVRAMTFLLGRRGYDVRSGLTARAIFTDVEDYKPDVVVLVEADSFGETVALADQILVLSDTVSVIVATTRHDAPPGNRLRFIERWAPFDVLAEAVERAWAELPPTPVR
jgi:hypothetical protein